MNGKDGGTASVLLEAAALNYARWHDAWSTQFSTSSDEGRCQLERAGDEVRAQLRERARAYTLAPGPDDRIDTIGEPEDHAP